MESTIDSITTTPDLATLLGDWLESEFPKKHIQIGWGHEAIYRGDPTLSGQTSIHVGTCCDTLFRTANNKQLLAADPDFFGKVKVEIERMVNSGEPCLQVYRMPDVMVVYSGNISTGLVSVGMFTRYGVASGNYSS